MGAGADKTDVVCLNLVDQREVAADMALAMIGPFPFQGWADHPARPS